MDGRKTFTIYQVLVFSPQMIAVADICVDI